jgi:hypothetical protein
MCINCENKGVDRRDLLKFGAAGIVALGLGGVSWQAPAADGAPTALPPGEAFAALKSGNERYVSHPELCSIDLAERQADCRAADRSEHAHRRPRRRGKAEDRRSDLRPENGCRHLSRLRKLRDEIGPARLSVG